MFQELSKEDDTIKKECEDNKEIERNGLCLKELYSNELSGFGTYVFEFNDKTKMIVKGKIKLIAGKSYLLKGFLTTYKGEEQLEVQWYLEIKPISDKGIKSYLRKLKGINTIKAECIYDMFGENSIDILINNPLAIADSIKGIGEKSVLKWQKESLKLEENRFIYIKLYEYGFSKSETERLIEDYGFNVINTIENDPYQLKNMLPNYNFLKCDELAFKIGFKPDNTIRIMAGIIQVLQNAKMQGHCYLPKTNLIKESINLLECKLTFNQMSDIYNTYKNQDVASVNINESLYTIDIVKLNECIEEYKKKININQKDKCRYIYTEINEELININIDNLVSRMFLKIEEDMVYLEKLYYVEKNFAEDIKRLSDYNKDYSKIQCCKGGRI